MSFTITEAFVQQYDNNVRMLAQQKGSRFRNVVMAETGVVGRRKSFDRLGQAQAQLITDRHGDSPQVDTPHSRRWATLADFEWGDLIDEPDKARTLNNMTNPYTMAGGNAMGRSMDDVVVAAATGTAVTGQEGAGTETWPVAGQQIVHGGVGLTLAKITQASRILNFNEVEEDDRFFAVSAHGLEDLLNDTTITSADFNTVRLLMAGQIDTFMGFRWVRSQRLLLSGTTRSCLAFHRGALGLAIGLDIRARVAERSDKRFSTYVYYAMSLGAVRVEAERMVEVQITE